ncbi:MAG: choice-of-anchor D domain-containing protein, partial [Methanophagales archaeon]|nr:choice-of-anchor D domain-containing protein [Methanophagales archaeon]
SPDADCYAKVTVTKTHEQWSNSNSVGVSVVNPNPIVSGVISIEDLNVDNNPIVAGTSVKTNIMLKNNASETKTLIVTADSQHGSGTAFGASNTTIVSLNPNEEKWVELTVRFNDNDLYARILFTVEDAITGEKYSYALAVSILDPIVIEKVTGTNPIVAGDETQFYVYVRNNADLDMTGIITISPQTGGGSGFGTGDSKMLALLPDEEKIVPMKSTFSNNEQFARSYVKVEEAVYDISQVNVLSASILDPIVISKIEASQNPVIAGMPTAFYVTQNLNCNKETSAIITLYPQTGGGSSFGIFDSKEVKIVVNETEEPVIFVSPSTWNFGTVTPGAEPNQTFTITNTGNADLAINSITPSCTYISISGISLPSTISPGSSKAFNARIDSSSLSGTTSEDITLSSNDPDELNKAIPVYGTVKVTAKHLLSVPYYNQGHTKWCLFYSFYMLLKYNNCDVKPWEIAECFDTEHESCLSKFKVYSIFDHTLKDFSNSRCSLATKKDVWGLLGSVSTEDFDNHIKESIDVGQPVLIGFSKKEHAIVAVGYDHQYIYLTDPSGAITQEVFNNNERYIAVPVPWSDFNEKLVEQIRVDNLAVTIKVLSDLPSSKSKGSIYMTDYAKEDYGDLYFQNRNNDDDLGALRFDGKYPDGYRIVKVGDPSVERTPTKNDMMSLLFTVANPTSAQMDYVVKSSFINKYTDVTAEELSSSWDLSVPSYSIISKGQTYSNQLSLIEPGDYVLIVTLFDLADVKLDSFYFDVTVN